MFLYSKPHISGSLRRGFSLVEVLVAVTIITIAFIAVLSASTRGVVLARLALEETQVSFLLEEGAEAVKFARDLNWSNISALTLSADYHPEWGANGWTIVSGSGVSGEFTRKIQFTSAYRDSYDDLASSGTVDSGTRKVTVSVAWFNGVATVTKNLEFYITDIF
ncbi:MAG: hypothetical protein UV08_C0009G0004 [Parcubacteria group bacterium GW2011_GWA2_42_18]|nr:MAG: hypothetical protein UV08_C0009G0004 [Parcubacteria group bacterium GW2011_GWA2_42_18]